MKSKLLSIRVILLLLATIVLVVASLRNQMVLNFCFTRVSYYLLWLMFSFWFIFLFRQIENRRDLIRSFLKLYGTGILFALGISILIFVTVPPYLRVLSDEATLLSASQSMTFDRQCNLILQGVNYGFSFRPLELAIPRRPLAFPFFIHILHALSGYRVENAFVLNFLAFFSLLSMVFVFVKKTLGNLWGFVSLVLIACQPIIVETATSAGFDLFALLLIFICFIALKMFLEAPSAHRFYFLWIHLLWLAHTRYESPVFILIVLVCLLLGHYLKKEFFNSSLLYPATPLLLLPILWQRLLAAAPYLELENDVAFSVSHLIRHSFSFFQYAFSFQQILPSALIINVMGLMGLVFFILLFFSKTQHTTKSNQHLFWISLASLLYLWIITNVYYYGDVTWYHCARYFTIYFFILSLLAAYFLKHSGWFEKQKGALAVLMILFFSIYHPMSYQQGFTNRLNLSRHYRHEMAFIKQQNKDKIFVISKNPIHYTIHNIGAANFETARKFTDRILADSRNKLYENIYAIQDIEITSGKPTPETDLSTGFALENVYEIQNSDNALLRISRVKLP